MKYTVGIVLLFLAFLQIFSNKLIRTFKSRKLLVCTAALIQSLMYILVALTFFFGKFSVYALIIFVSFYYMLGMALNPAWTSWMGDLVNEKKAKVNKSWFKIHSALLHEILHQSLTNQLMLKAIRYTSKPNYLKIRKRLLNTFCFMNCHSLKAPI